MMVSHLYERIKQRLDELGLSERQASLMAVKNTQLIRNIRTGKSRSPRGENIVELARVLHVSEGWLLGASEPSHAPQDEKPEGIRYSGIVEASTFRPVDLFDQDSEHRIIPIAPDPRYPPAMQGAYQVEGDSMDRAHIYPGMWLHAIDYDTWRRRHGDPPDRTIVVATHTREHLGERELTVKLLRVFRDRLELHPQSSNPVHRPIAIPSEPQEGNEKIYILAVVAAATWLFGFKG